MALTRLICPECSAALRLAQEVPAGKQIKCPKCGTVFRAEAQSTEITSRSDAPSPRAARSADDNQARPRRSKKPPRKKPNIALIVLPILAGIVLLAGAVIAITFLWGIKKDQTVASIPTAIKPAPGAPGMPLPPDRPAPPQQPAQPINAGGNGAANPDPSPAPPPMGSRPAAPGKVTESGKVGLAIGDIAKEIDGEDIDGKKFKLSDYRGKVVVLDFWGHW